MDRTNSTMRRGGTTRWGERFIRWGVMGFCIVYCVTGDSLATQTSSTTQTSGSTKSGTAQTALGRSPVSQASRARGGRVRKSNGGISTPRTGDGVSGPAPSSAMGESERKERIAKLEAQAGEYFRQQNYDRAYASLSMVTQMDPTLAPAETILARWFAQIGSERGMVAQLENATRNVPDDPEAYIHLAAETIKNGRLTEASLLLGRAQQLLETYDRSPDRKIQLEKLLWTTLASFLEARSDWKSLLGTLQSLEKQDPDNVENLVQIARVFMKLNDEADARLTLEKAFQKNPNLASPDALLAGLYDQERDPENSLKRIRRAITEFPENARNREMAVRIFFRNNELDLARQSLEFLLQNDSQNAGTHVLAGDLAIAQNQIDLAKNEYSQAIRLDPSDLKAGMGYVCALILGGKDSDLRKAIEITTQTVQNNPNETRLLLYHAWALSATGSPERAVKIIEPILPVWTMDQDEAYLIAACTSRLVDQTLPRRLIEASLKEPRNFMFRSRMEKLQQELDGIETGPAPNEDTTTPPTSVPEGTGLPSLNPFASASTNADPTNVDSPVTEPPPVDAPVDPSVQTEAIPMETPILTSAKTSASVSPPSKNVTMSRVWRSLKTTVRSTQS